jgi:small subunit ribosomal protein S16
MPARIRLQRHGKKGNPFYHIVIADGRAPRDGKFIERIGTYNPLAIPAEINIDFDKALAWLNKGAQPSDTARAILTYKGVLFKNHLLKGVAKGALTLEQAEAKFQVWMQEKEVKISAKKNEIVLTKKEKQKKRHEAEIKANLAKAQEVAKKKAKELAKELAVEEAPVEAEVETEVEAAVEETPVEETVVETPVAEEAVVEEVVAETTPEVIAEVVPEVTDEVSTEVASEETPATEEPTEEKPE